MFKDVVVGQHYTRNELAKLWGYSGYEAIARGVVTPRGTNKIILFVTREKQASFEQYRNELVGDVLDWEGPTDHFGEGRMVEASQTGDEIHLFYRPKHHEPFEYKGQTQVEQYQAKSDGPSSFKLKVVG